MDFEDNFKDFDKIISLEDDIEDTQGFGLNDREIRELEKLNDAVVFVIDWRLQMMQRNEFNDTAASNFETVIKAAVGFLKTKIIANETDQTGIILYNCDKTQNSLNFEGIYAFEKLDRPNAETIKALDTLIDSKEVRFKSSENEVSLSDVLCTWQQQFKALDVNSYTKRIFLFTNEEDPMKGMPKEKNETIERGKALSDEEIEIELFPMSHPNLNKREFDVKLFFSNILTVDEEELSDLKDYESAYMRVQDLSRRIRLKEFKKRVLGKWMFSLAQGMKVGLKFFNLTKHTKKPNAKFINKNTSKELKTFTKYKWNTTNESLYRSQIGTHFPLKDK